MADDVVLNSGSGGDTIAADEIGGKKHQRVKVQHGADGSATDVSASSPLPVDQQSALPAGTNAIGKLAANSGVDIGDVDITSQIPGTGATNLGKAEDAAHSSGDTGVMFLAVRNDTVAALAGTDGDYSPLQVDADGCLYVKGVNNNLISSNNSSTSVLGGGATFTGTSDDITNYSSVSIQVFVSHASATDGLSMEFSTDNSNWDEKHVATIAATTEREFIFPAHANYFRVVYTNGGTLQTAFRLQVILHTQGLPGSSHALDENVAADDVGPLIKSVVLAQSAGTGNFIPVQATSGGNFKVSVEEADTSASGLAKAEDGAHSSGDVGVMSLSVRQNTAASTSGADGDYQPLITDTNGRLHVLDQNSAAILADTANMDTNLGTVAGAVSGSEMQADIVAALPAGTNAIGKLAANTGVDIGDVDVLSVAGTVTVDGSGVTQPVSGTVTANLSATDNTVLDNIDTSLNNIEAAVAGSEMQVDVVAALPAGTNAIGKLSANSGVDIGDVDVTSISAGSNLVGDVGISGARTSGGTTAYRNVDVDETEDEVKATAGQVYWIQCVTIDATPLYLHLYNATAANVTVGTTTPLLTFLVPSQGDANGAGFSLSVPNGIAFGTAITVAATTTVGGTTGPGTNECILAMGYA